MSKVFKAMYSYKVWVQNVRQKLELLAAVKELNLSRLTFNKFADATL